MAAVALLIYLPRYARQQRLAQPAFQRQSTEQAAAEARATTQARIQAQQVAAQTRRTAEREAARKAEAELAAYRSKYLNPGFARTPGVKSVAVAAASDNNTIDRPVADALVSRLKDEDIALSTSFFKPAFYTDGLFANMFAGSLDAVDRLQLTNTLDALLLAQEHVQYVTNGADVNNIITAHTRLDVAFYPFDMMRREQSWTFKANGAGFSPGEALGNAEERLFKQVAGDTNLSLVPISSNNQESSP